MIIVAGHCRLKLRIVTVLIQNVILLKSLRLKYQITRNVFAFNHETHLKEYPTNLKLRCTGCHSYMGKEVQGGAETKHFGIDENTCFACHFIKGKNSFAYCQRKD